MWAPAGVLLELFYPRFCVVCGIGIAREEEFLCRSCRDGLEECPEGVCSVCGLPLEGEVFPDWTCRECLSDPPPFRKARGALLYRGAVTAAIVTYKYGSSPWLSVPLGKILFQAFRRFYPDADYDGIVPVPLHPRKRKERGFDQVGMLAAELAVASGLRPLRRGLLRDRPTADQAALARPERLRNVRGAFRVPRPGRVRGGSFLLVDDVYTTGATIRECARVLAEAGAARVDVLCLARVGEAWG